MDALTAATAWDSTAPPGGSDCLSVSQPQDDSGGGGDATTSDPANEDLTAPTAVTVAGACRYRSLPVDLAAKPASR